MPKSEKPRQARVRIHEPLASAPATATQDLIAKALKEEVLVDGKNRRLMVRKPSALAQFRLIEAMGDTAQNQTYMQMIQPLIYLAKIDEDLIPTPSSKEEVEALITRLDDEGLASLMGWYVANVVGPTNAAVDAAVRAAKEKAALKN